MLKTKRTGIAAALTILVFLSGCSQKQTQAAVKTETRAAVAAAKPTVSSTKKSSVSGVSMIDTPDSTCFSEIGYDSSDNVLYVTFRDSGKSYCYYDVPGSVWRELSAAKSKGGYFNSDIKGSYDYKKLN